MDDAQSLPDLVAAARTNAKTSANHISEILALLGDTRGSVEQADDMGGEITVIELAA